MSDNGRLEIDTRELEAAFMRLTAGVKGEALRRAALAGALPIENEWKDLTLEDPTTYKTGTYRRSVHREVVGESDAAVDVAVGTDITDPPYPLFLEFGTSRMAARPKARPAYESKRKEAEKETQLAFAELILKAAQG
ncbi:MAG: hypothetical protein DWQ07_14145 [Chloroflexi bacterium]|nr:MAG: hypothetical protein DWQ07_14145 [Chloroflexota bacterium]